MNTLLETKQNKKNGSFQASAKDRQTVVFKNHLNEFSNEAQQTNPNSDFQHDFSHVRVQSALPPMLHTSQTSACPLSPRSCPTGGTCHTCPAKVQAKLTINQPSDKYEQEADHLAAKVIQMAEPAEDRGGYDTSVTEAPKNLQRLPETQTSTPTIPPLVTEVISSPGQSLDTATRSFAEPRFGFDFSQVRLHTDERAARSAQALKARAYTVGRNIVFAQGQYQPQAAGGRQLLAHELTHVVQQSGTVHHHIQRAPVGGATSGTTSTRPEREERFNIGRGGNRFDAEFDHWRCLLTLKMKVAFNFLSSGGENSAESWPSPAAQRNWQESYIRAVTNRWSYRYYLEPDSPCPDENCSRAYARVQVLPVTSNPHFTMNIAYTTDFEGSSVNRNPTSAAVGREATMDALDVRQRTDIPQVPAEHEFGHMLGLPHVHCDTNAEECYGVTAEERANVMGEGKNVSERDYRVFAEAMYYFNGCNWHATHGTSRQPMGDFPVPSGDTAMA